VPDAVFGLVTDDVPQHMGHRWSDVLNQHDLLGILEPIIRQLLEEMGVIDGCVGSVTSKIAPSLLRKRTPAIPGSQRGRCC
jgi:hypothetical protein